MLQPLLLPFTGVDWSPMFILITDELHHVPNIYLTRLKSCLFISALSSGILRAKMPSYKKQYIFIKKELNHQHFFLIQYLPSDCALPQRLSITNFLILVQTTVLSSNASPFTPFH